MLIIKIKVKKVKKVVYRCLKCPSNFVVAVRIFTTHVRICAYFEADHFHGPQDHLTSVC
jgi:hypothetical protein